MPGSTAGGTPASTVQAPNWQHLVNIRFVKDQPGAFRNENRRICWIYFKPTPAGVRAGFTFIRHGVEWQREKSRQIDGGIFVVWVRRFFGPSRFHESLRLW